MKSRLTEIEQKHYSRLLRWVRFNRRRRAHGLPMTPVTFYTTLRMWIVAADEA